MSHLPGLRAFSLFAKILAERRAGNYFEGRRSFLETETRQISR
jgi:hypothetical protein